MADLSKLKRRTTLGAPPPIEEASANLTAPETAPIAEAPATEAMAPLPRKATRGEGRGAASAPALRELDGRSARRTNRTVQFATRVTPDFDTRIREISRRDGLLLVEVMEAALDAYEARRKS